MFGTPQPLVGQGGAGGGVAIGNLGGPPLGQAVEEEGAGRPAGLPQLVHGQQVLYVGLEELQQRNRAIVKHGVIMQTQELLRYMNVYTCVSIQSSHRFSIVDSGMTTCCSL